MKTVVPDYYKSFRCIAGKCRHTCCAHWEIDVDEDSLERYRNVGGEFGRKLRDNIETGECPHFILKEDERCPFLNSDNLCEIYINMGEDALCQICTDHPRFRSFFYDRTEIGLGLCCEAAASLILGKKEKTELVTLDDDGEEEEYDGFDDEMLFVRDNVTAVLQDRNISVSQRFEKLEKDFCIEMPEMSPEEWSDFLMGLERLDEEWAVCLKELSQAETPDFKVPEELELPFEQLAVYFAYRHIPQAEGEGDLKNQIAFVIWACRIIGTIYAIRAERGEGGFETLTELARLFSSEIEYSEENTDAVLDVIWTANPA